MFISIVFVFISFLLAFFLYINHTRISKMNTGQEEFMELAKQKLLYIDHVLNEKITKNQRVTAEIIEILMRKMRAIETRLTDEELEIGSEITNINDKLQNLRRLNELYADIGVEQLEQPTAGTPVLEEGTESFTNDIPMKFQSTSSRNTNNNDVMKTYLR